MKSRTWSLVYMTIEEIIHAPKRADDSSSGRIDRWESKNTEFKEELPKKSEKYTKTVVAYANTQGGKLIFGVVDDTRDVVGIDETILFQAMDSIANAISDSCEPPSNNIPGSAKTVLSEIQREGEWDVYPYRWHYETGTSGKDHRTGNGGYADFLG